MSREEAIELIERMEFIPAIQGPNDKYRIGCYKAAADSKEPLEWIRVIKTHYLRTHTASGEIRTVHAQETEYATVVKSLLEKELANALNIQEEEVGAYIKKRLDDSWN
ncbi:MAG: hypothetical protein LBN22_01945 [Clostridiales Family XIII bacterium]|jgi:CarD family transcriptional regulator|nr:hypothetical protein [Clostridiales Family XIII bacterium]